ncbi:MAG: bifunctional helix-turn-helix transcriptional regulator/GNAT family N-acetyltransferase [Chloroflexota bacterium]
MAVSAVEARVQAVRRFNRFYTQVIGVLRQDYLSSPFSLAEVRVLYELAHRPRLTASELCRDLDLDPGYLSRILRGFQRQGLLEREHSAADGRQRHLWLSARGREVFAPLHERSSEQIAGLLARLSEDEQERLLAAMHTVERLLAAPAETAAPPAPYLLRDPRAGELGWVVQRHGALYEVEYGYDADFEALVAEIVAKFVQHRDPARERCWIAEWQDEPVGSVFVVKHEEKVAKLRLFLVEPRARGLGIGRRLVEECLAFARAAGYEKIVLWTQSELLAARRIYERAGFRLVAEEPHHSFSKDLVAETWERAL